MNHLTNPIFQDENQAREWLESQVWPEGPTCPHCGVAEFTRLEGKAHRPGLYQCNACREQFTVTVGTVMERSKIPLTKWLMAVFLITASKKGMSAHQLHRMLGVSYKSTWFMMHRIREAMKDGSLGPLGGEGKVIEADETYYGAKPKGVTGRKAQGPGGKSKIVALVERGGKARAFHVDNINAATVRKVVLENASTASKLMTDEAGVYPSIGLAFKGHERVMHSAGEYVRYEADRVVHTNTIEGFFSIFKRGMRGVYQKCGEQHLQRYLTEFEFRYSNRAALGVTDGARAVKLVKGIQGKRLTYRRTQDGQANG